VAVGGHHPSWIQTSIAGSEVGGAAVGPGGLRRWSLSRAELRRDGPRPPGGRVSAAARWCGGLGAPNLPRNLDLRRVTWWPRWTTRTSSGKYFSASRGALRRSRAPAPSASAGAASPPTPGSSAASVSTTGRPPCSASSPTTEARLASLPCWIRRTASPPLAASLCGFKGAAGSTAAATAASLWSPAIHLVSLCGTQFLATSAAYPSPRRPGATSI
jgi:hypothetical protein